MGSHEADGTMMMLLVVPAHEARDPDAGFLRRGESAGWEVGPVLAGAKKRRASCSKNRVGNYER